VCSICGKGFNQQSSLRGHMMIHMKNWEAPSFLIKKVIHLRQWVSLRHKSCQNMQPTQQNQAHVVKNENWVIAISDIYILEASKLCLQHLNTMHTYDLTVLRCCLKY
jgi:hypothetical protein